MNAEVVVRVLGPLSIVADGAELDLSGKKLRSLVGLLAARAPQAVSTDLVLEALWGEDVPEGAPHSLHTHVSNARKLLSEAGIGIDHIGDGYRLDVLPDMVDVVRFERLVTEGLAASDDPAEASGLLTEALGLWRGPPLGELAHEPWMAPTTSFLEARRMEAVNARVDAELTLGHHDRLVGELESAVVEFPLREDLWARLMVALYRSGRQADALAAFRAASQVLGEELGIEPGPELVALEERVLLHDPSLGTSAERPRQIPALRTELLGRSQVISEIDARLTQGRIVTLTGPGGVGKTSLAVAVAGELDDDIGVWFCDLVPVTDPGGVGPALAATFGLQSDDPHRSVSRVAHWIGDSTHLIVVDNCEHVLARAAAVIDELIRACPRLRILATSRQPLGIPGEVVIPVAPLDPDAAVDLLHRRARDAANDPDPSPKVAELCARLDHLPLAIELVAARLGHLSVDEILGYLDEGIRVVSGHRSDHPRHAALEATIEWSVRLLGEVESRVLHAASVFAGDFDLTGVASVAGVDPLEAMDAVGSLVSRSLVVTDRRGEVTRYRMLETIRGFALDRVREAGELETWRRRHAEHYVAMSESIAPHPPDRHPWSRLLENDPNAGVDLPNHIQALEWLIGHDRLVDAARLGARMVAVRHYNYFDHDRRVLEREDAAAALTDLGEKALYLTASAIGANSAGRWDKTLEFGLRAVELDADPHSTAIAAGLAAQMAFWDRPERIDPLLQKGHERLPPDSVELDRFLRERRADGLILIDPEDAVRQLETLLAEGSIYAGWELPLGYHLIGRDDSIGPLLDTFTPDQGTSNLAFRIPLGWAFAHLAADDVHQARAALVRSAREALRHPGTLVERDVLVGCAALASAEGRFEDASKMLAVVNGTTRTPASHALYLRYRDAVKSEVPKARIAEVRAEMRGRSATATLQEVLDDLISRG